MTHDERLRTLRAVEAILKEDGYEGKEVLALVNDLIVDALESVTESAAEASKNSEFERMARANMKQHYEDYQENHLHVE